jgi:hypothetical protein
MDRTWLASHLQQILAKTKLDILRINKILSFKKALIMKNNKGLMAQL